MLLRQEIRALRLDYEAYEREARDMALSIMEKGVLGNKHTLNELVHACSRDGAIAVMLASWEEKMK